MDAAAAKGPEGTVVAGAGSTTQSVKEKILNREKKAPTTIDGSQSSSSPAGGKEPTPQTDPNQKP